MLQVPFTSHWCLILHVIFLLFAIFPLFFLETVNCTLNNDMYINTSQIFDVLKGIVCYRVDLKSCWEFIWIRFPSFPKSFINPCNKHQATRGHRDQRDQLLWIAWKVSVNALPQSCWLLQRWDFCWMAKKTDKAKSVLLSEVTSLNL